MKQIYFNIILLASIGAGAQIQAMGAGRQMLQRGAKTAGEYLAKESGALKEEAEVLGKRAEALKEEANVLRQEANVARQQANIATEQAGAAGRGVVSRGAGLGRGLGGQPSAITQQAVEAQRGLMQGMGGQTREFSTSCPAEGLREIYEWGKDIQRRVKEGLAEEERKEKEADLKKQEEVRKKAQAWEDSLNRLIEESFRKAQQERLEEAQRRYREEQKTERRSERRSQESNQKPIEKMNVTDMANVDPSTLVGYFEKNPNAYNELALKFHPDVNKDPNATAAFQKINEANALFKERSKK